MIRTVLFTSLFLVGLGACQPSTTPEQYNPKAANPQLLNDCAKTLTNIMIHDIFKPPVASRIYGYTYLASYEALRPGHQITPSLLGKLNGSTPAPAPRPAKRIVFRWPV